MALLVAVLALLPYLGTLNHGFVWDDHDLIESNRSLLEHPARSFSAPFTIGTESTPYYRPVVVLSFALDNALWGRNARGYHASNLLIHALSASAVFWLLSAHAGLFLAAVSAAFFALHPLHVESVAFVSGRSDLLSGLFLLGALLAMSRSLAPGAAGRVALSCATFVLFFLSLSSKESSAFLPLFVLFLLWLLRARGSAVGAAWTTIVPTLLAFLAYLAARTLAMSGSGAPLSAHFPLSQYPWFSLKALGLLFAPWQTLPYYEPPSPNAATILLLLVSIAALAAGLFLLARERGDDVILPAAAAWLLLSALPALPLFRQSGSILADRFLYLPSLGATVLVGCLFESLLSASRGRRFVKFVLVSAALVATSMGLFSALRALEWRSDLDLFTAAAHRAPSNPGLQFLAGEAWLERNDREKAEVHFRRAVHLRPTFVRALIALGELEAGRGRAAEAEGFFRRALASGSERHRALFALGKLEMDRGDSREAAALFERAVEIQPGFSPAYVNLGYIAYQAGDRAGAERYWVKALEWSPDNVEALNNVGVLAKQRGDFVLARRSFLRALAVDPGYADAQRNLRNLGPPPPR